MKVLEKIKRCVSLVWGFQEIYGDEDIEDFCSNELNTYSQYNEILDYFKRITELEQENKVLAQNLEDTEIVNKALEKENAELNNFIMQSKKDGISPINALIIKNLGNQLTKATEIIKKLKALYFSPVVIKDDVKRQDEILAEVEQFLKDSEVEK